MNRTHATTDFCFIPNRSLTETEQNEERLCNYERYRVLIHNESTGGKSIDEKENI